VGPQKAICPKCGSELQPDKKGRAYCVMCGKTYYVCVKCLEEGRTDYENIVFSSPKALAGHMRSHKKKKATEERLSELCRLIADLASLDEEAELMLSTAQKLSTSSASPVEAIQLALMALLIKEIRGLKGELANLKALRICEAKQPRGPQTYSGDLPSFVRGNPWIAVLAGRGKWSESSV